MALPGGERYHPAPQFPHKILGDVPTHGVGKLIIPTSAATHDTSTAAKEESQLRTAEADAANASAPKVRKRKLADLVSQIHPMERLDPDTEQFVLELADDFIDQAVQRACKAAKHRKSDTLGVKDLQLELERNWNLRIPGFPDELRSFKRPTVNAAHQSRLAMVNKHKRDRNLVVASEKAKARFAEVAESVTVESATVT
ncbi:hypothetical protein HDV00_003816 [Rhizophlyctis rosea]|nr:hypothetical protein HDV00_003816 [Rhizophlyctis rosea]